MKIFVCAMLNIVGTLVILVGIYAFALGIGPISPGPGSTDAIVSVSLVLLAYLTAGVLLLALSLVVKYLAMIAGRIAPRRRKQVVVAPKKAAAEGEGRSLAA